jgi:predicted alpha/beta-hydrolase family hydrolase
MTPEPFEAGFLHRPENTPRGALVLTHGAGSNCRAPLLVAIADAFAETGLLVYRYDLPFRRQRPHGSPFPAIAKADREGVREAVAAVRSLTAGPVFAGGHSYGGRQTSMAAAEDAALAAGLLLLSYPLHPPKKPEQLRTGHFPDLRTRGFFVHGSKDGFGSEEEMREALKQIPAPTGLYLVEGAGHELGRNHTRLALEIIGRAGPFLAG